MKNVDLHHGASSDVGLVRKVNEDSFLVAPPVFVVADGMGGHSGGDVASQMVVPRAASNQAVRVRSQLLDRLMNQAGEVMITRSRLENELKSLRSSLNDLTGNLDRLRSQLRDIEVQAESQMQSRLAQAKEAGIDGLIVVDLPPEEDDELCLPAQAAGLNFIRLATPTTDDRRLPKVLQNTSGFVYYVSITGITGSASAARAEASGS